MKKIGNIFKTKNPEKIAEEIAKSYKEKKENGEENPIDNTVEEIMEIIEKNYDPKTRREILTEIIQKLPTRVFEKTATKISESEEIPDKVITDVVEKSDVNISDETINRIIEEGNINVVERIKLIKNVEDRSIIEERVKNELEILYKVCKEKRDNEVVERVNKIKELIDKKDMPVEIQNLIQQVVAKKMAENYYSEISKGTNIYTLSQIISAEDMIKKDLVSLVEKEYKKIEDDRGNKEGRFDKKGLKIQILIEVSKTIAKKYDEAGVFIIPQSENMKKINKDEEKMFIRAIQTYARKELSKQEIVDIDEQIRGRSNNSQIKENILINSIKNIPEKNKNKIMDLLIKVIENNENLETISMLDELGLIEKLNEMSKEKREKSIKTIEKVLENRENKVAKNSPKIINNQKIEKYRRDREDR